MRTAVTFDDVLLVPQYSEVTPDMVDTSVSIGGLDLEIPIISAPMDTVTETDMACEMSRLGGLGIIHKNMSHSEQIEMVHSVRQEGYSVGAAVSPTNYTEHRNRNLIIALEDRGVDFLVLDSAHGHSLNVINALKEIKQLTDVPVIVGNIATEQAAVDLKEAGADVLKVGIGPGSICTTRIVSGVGVPQITAIKDVYAARTGLPIIADGGIRYSGDIAKAIAAGADCVMLGSLLAGHDEVPNYKGIIIDGKRYVPYRGMGSEGAMNDGSGDRYSQDGSSKFVPEGIEGCIPYRGRVEDTVYQLVGGLRSAMGYCGTATIEDLKKTSSNYWHMKGFVGVSSSSLKENHPHSLSKIEEASNYVPA